jgi:hypothetical protein
MSLNRNYGKLYQAYHVANPKHFSGKLSAEQVDAIKTLVDWAKPSRMLDFGSGKGYQYLERRLHEQWGGLLPHCYDVGVIQLGNRPAGTFGGVICTDVREHIDERDVDAIFDDVFSFVAPAGPAFAYFHISTRAAGKSFDDGENVHLTVKPSHWWDRKLARFHTRDDLAIRVTYGL